nr:hypothetical protein [Tanacetum cinerariifolium]
MDQNIDFSGYDQIQTPQYPEIHPPSNEISDKGFQAKGDLMKSIQTFLEEFNYIPFEEKPHILLQAWYKFFTIKHAQPEDSNKLFQKLLEDLKELEEYVKSPSRDHPTFFDENEEHSVQNKEYLENPSNEIATSNQEKEGPPQDSDIRQLIREECGIEVCEEKKQKIEDTILELVKICHQKELLCMHDNVNDLIESALSSKLLSINSQRLNKEKKEVKNVVEQPTEHGNLHVIAPILSTKESEYSPSMGYENPNTTLETKSDEIIKSGVEELVPIQSEYEVTSDDESKCDMPIQDQSSLVFTTFSNPLFKDNDDLTSSDDESLSEKDVPIEESKVYSNPLFDDDEINSDELESHIDYLEEFSGELAHINPEITESDFDFEEEIRFIKNLLMDDVLPPGVENDDDSEGEIDVVEELHVDNSISNSVNELSVNKESDFDNPSVLRPPPEPPDAKFDFEPDTGDEISVVMNTIVEFDVSNDENDDYFPFMFVIRIFLSCLICSKMFLSFLFAESEDAIFDPGISV